MIGLWRTLWVFTAPAAFWLVLPVKEGGFDRYHLPKELLLALLALLLFVPGWRTCERLGRDAVTRLTLLLGALSLVASLAATSPTLALRGVSLQLSACLLFLMARTQSPRERERTRLWLVVGLSGVSLLACAEIFGLVTQLSRSGRTPGASLGQRNMVAHLLALGAPSAFALLAGTEARRRRVLAALASVLLAFVIVHTRSRAGWFALAAALIVFELTSVRGALKRGVASALVGLGVVLALAVPTRLVWSSTTPYRDSLVHLLDSGQGSGRGRLAQYQSSLAMLREQPLLGVGPGNWLVHYPQVSPPGDPAFSGHTWLNTGRLVNSDLLALLLEQGPLAVLLDALLVWSLAREGSRTRERGLVYATLAAGIVAGSLDAVLQLPSAVCCAALALGSSSWAEPGSVRNPSHAKWLGATLVLGLSLASVLSLGRLLALWERTRPSGGYAAAESALRFHPSDLSARFSLAEAYVLQGDCVRARPHIATLRSLLPYHEAPRNLEAACLAD
jgi:O-antigen ligase